MHLIKDLTPTVVRFLMFWQAASSSSINTAYFLRFEGGKHILFLQLLNTQYSRFEEADSRRSEIFDQSNIEDKDQAKHIRGYWEKPPT